MKKGLLKLAKRFLLPTAIVSCMLMLLIMPLVSSSAEKVTIYFYSSETNINNFKSLKMEFDSYLSKFGPYEFQPFSNVGLFEQHIKNKDRCLLLLSSWHYSKINRENSLSPLLVGTRNGKKYQKRILVATEKFASLSIAQRGPVASASNVPYTRSVLRDMFSAKNIADSVRILTVPKDVDALMSVGFEMSKCALITENALSNLKLLDPILFKKMKTLAEGKASLLLIVAAPESFAQEAQGITKILRAMPRDPDGKSIIKMLDLDNWGTIDASDNSKLEG